MGGEGGLWEVDRNRKPELVEDNGRQESMGAEGGARDGGIPQPEP
jgi:hypothetical protein